VWPWLVNHTTAVLAASGGRGWHPRLGRVATWAEGQVGRDGAVWANGHGASTEEKSEKELLRDWAATVF
jgi:hypothetical protein